MLKFFFCFFFAFLLNSLLHFSVYDMTASIFFVVVVVAEAAAVADALLLLQCANSCQVESADSIFV